MYTSWRLVYHFMLSNTTLLTQSIIKEKEKKPTKAKFKFKKQLNRLLLIFQPIILMALQQQLQNCLVIG